MKTIILSSIQPSVVRLSVVTPNVVAPTNDVTGTTDVKVRISGFGFGARVLFPGRNCKTFSAVI